jgi:hypothetical protein
MCPHGAWRARVKINTRREAHQNSPARSKLNVCFCEVRIMDVYVNVHVCSCIMRARKNK